MIPMQQKAEPVRQEQLQGMCKRRTTAIPILLPIFFIGPRMSYPVPRIPWQHCGKCDDFHRRLGAEGGEFPEPLYRGGGGDDHYLLRDPDAGAVIVLLDGEDRTGCGSEWSEDQGMLPERKE